MLSVDSGSILEHMPGAIGDGDRWRESQGKSMLLARFGDDADMIDIYIDRKKQAIAYRWIDG